MEMKTYKNPKLQEEMYSVIHPSGLQVYLFPKKGFQKYYAVYGTKYGSIDRSFQVPGDKDYTTVPDGIAHYLEHKMFEEADGGNAFDRFAITGASSNAFTSFDLTAYLFSCTDSFYENLDILLDFVNTPCFTPENVAKEQGIIGQEIKMYDDDPEWRVFFNTLTAMFHHNPVKIDIAGTTDSIAQITPELLYRCYHTFYNPANMVLVMVGDIDMEKAMSYVDKYVDAKRNLGQIPRNLPQEPKTRVQERITQELMVSRPLFRVGFKDAETNLTGTALLKKELCTEIILEALFGRTSDLYMELYEEGLIDNSFGAETDIAEAYGFSLIGGESTDPEQVYQRILETIRCAIRDGIPKDALQRARKSLISGYIRIFNSVEKIGNAMLRQVMAGCNPLAYEDVVKEITDQDITKRLADHFNPENGVLSVVKPTEASTGA